MKIAALIFGLVVGLAVFARRDRAETPADELPAPGFHHLHLNSTDPESAIDFYIRQFPSTSRSSFAGFPALKAGPVYVLFTRVSTPPATEPQTAIWHFGWHVVDVRQNLERYQREEIRLLPLYTTDQGGFVFVSSDTWPGAGGTLGRTRAQIAEARSDNLKPPGGAGFAYLQGPDNAIVEYQGNMPVERFNHVHMFQEDPYCAQLWYLKHLNAKIGPGQANPTHTEADCKVPRGERSWPALDRQGMFRVPGAGVTFGDVALNWYANQGDAPLVGTRGHLADHIALSVNNLDAWCARLQKEGVKFLAEPYKLGGTRAAMIEGPSREAIELVEVRE